MDKRKGFLIDVELKFINEIVGHGVFAREAVSKGTELWKPNLVEKIPSHKVVELLKKMTRDKANEFLRQGFILASDLDHLCVNVDDLGRFTNHSSNPNMGYADFTPDEAERSIALKDISIEDELTCDYNGLGSPQWYKQLCVEYNVLATDEVTKIC